MGPRAWLSFLPVDAKTFITNKRDAAVEELNALEAEYLARKKTAQAMVDLTKQWMEELGGNAEDATASVPATDVSKASGESWVSARDLTTRSTT